VKRLDQAVPTELPVNRFAFSLEGGHVSARRGAKCPPVLTAELGRTLVTACLKYRIPVQCRPEPLELVCYLIVRKMLLRKVGRGHR
jgi:hypothetical protein